MTLSSVTPKPLEYVTIDRGSPTRGQDNPFVTPLPFGNPDLDDPETERTPVETPKSGVRGSVRDLE